MIFLENPWRFFSLLEKTYFDFFDDYVKSFIGVLGWLDFELDFFVYLFFLVFFGFIIGSFFKKINISKSQAFIYFLVGTELEFVIMVIAVSCVKLLSAHNSTQHTSRKHKV
jgi:hypothetical protein